MPPERPLRPDLLSMLGATRDEDRHRDSQRRHAHDRALLETRAERASWSTRLAAATLRVVRPDRHSLTSYPCRLPSGGMGRVAVVQIRGEWTLVCRVA
jgi:hypothetical protein